MLRPLLTLISYLILGPFFVFFAFTFASFLLSSFCLLPFALHYYPFFFVLFSPITSSNKALLYIIIIKQPSTYIF